MCKECYSSYHILDEIPTSEASLIITCKKSVVFVRRVFRRVAFFLKNSHTSGTWLFLNFCFFFSARNGSSDKAKRRDEEGNLRIIIIAQNVSKSTHKTQQRDTSAFEEGRTEKSRREARCSTNAARYLFIYTRDTSREEETCSRTEQQRHRRGRSLLCRHRTYERAKEGEAIDEHAQRRRRLSLRFRGVFLNELSSLRF